MKMSNALRQIRAGTDAAPTISWNDTVEYFRGRGGVLFLSYCAFWGKNPLTQQCLAKALAESGIPVTWIEIAESSKDTDFTSPLLRVIRIKRLKGRRRSLIAKLDSLLTIRKVQAEKQRLGENPIVWVQGGWDESELRHLPTIDVYSVFDDPFRHELQGGLCQRSKLILTQNSFAQTRFGQTWPQKTHLFLPPRGVEARELPDRPPFSLPPLFPK